jgi:hypothetical protein
MKKKILLRFAILIFSVGITLLVMEAVVRKVNPQITFSQAVSLSINCYAYDPDIPFKLGNNFTCGMTNQAGEFNVHATLNSLGYRGKNFQLDKPKGVKRILMIGDSMTFGWGLDDKDTYPLHLEDDLRSSGYSNIEVINGGYVGGLSPDSFYIYLKKHGLLLKPDLIVVNIFVWNDLSDLSESVWEKVDVNGLPEKISSCCHTVDGRIFRNKVVDFQYSIPILRESHLFILTVKTLQQRFNLLHTPQLLAPKSEQILGCVMNPDCIYKFYPEEQKTDKVLAGMKQLADEAHVPILFVLLPVDVQLYKESWAKYSRYNMQWFPKTAEENFIQKRLATFMDSKGIRYFDMYSYFDKNRDKGYPFFPVDAHFNPLGSRLAGDALSHFLLENITQYGLK